MFVIWGKTICYFGVLLFLMRYVLDVFCFQ